MLLAKSSAYRWRRQRWQLIVTPAVTSARVQKILPDVRVLLTKAPSYRAFLKVYFEETGLSYAEIGRRAGFSSRSYPRDITEGRRRLTVKSLPILMKGLRLETGLARLFKLLYFAEYPDEHPDALTIFDINELIAKQRVQLARIPNGIARRKLKLPAVHATHTSFAEGLTDVIAALGTVDQGITLEDIHKRTGLSKTFIAGKLERLVTDNVVAYHANTRRYSPGYAHIDWTGEPGSHLAQTVFRNSVARLDNAAKDYFASGEAMFLTSAISVSKSDLPKLKAELREVILKFVDGAVESGQSDDTVVQIVSGLFEGRVAKPMNGL